VPLSEGVMASGTARPHGQVDCRAMNQGNVRTRLAAAERNDLCDYGTFRWH
jgi:hypothetical protein